MNFANEKLNSLTRPDRSRKGSIDRPISSLVGLINRSSNYYTTSSCSGRILLLRPGTDKKSTSWLIASHAPVRIGQIKSALSNPPEGEIWLRQEAMILHVRCSSLEDAGALLSLSRKAGFRRAGIISVERLVVEIIGSAHFETLVAKNRKILADDNLLLALIDAANARLKKNFEMIEKFSLAFHDSL